MSQMGHDNFNRNEPHSAHYSKPFPIAAPAACMVQTELNEGGVRQRLIQFSYRPDREWLSKHAFWCMDKRHRLTTYIIEGEDLADAIASGIECSEQLKSFMRKHR